MNNKLKWYTKTFLFLSLGGLLFLSSCRKDADFLDDPVIEIPGTIEVENGALHGIVLDEQNNILRDATVRLFHYDMLIAETSSDNEGVFYLTDFAAIDEYTLSVTKDEYVSYVNSISENILDGEQIEINLVSQSYLTASGNIGMINPEDSTLINLTGRIVDDSGQPISQTIVLAFTQDFYFGNISITDFDGRFSILVPKSENIILNVLANCVLTFQPDIELGSFETDYDTGDLLFTTDDSYTPLWFRYRLSGPSCH